MTLAFILAFENGGWEVDSSVFVFPSGNCMLASHCSLHGQSSPDLWRFASDVLLSFRFQEYSVTLSINVTEEDTLKSVLVDGKSQFCSSSTVQLSAFMNY